MLRTALVAGLALVAEQSGRLSTTTGMRLATLVPGLTFIAEQAWRLVRERRSRSDAHADRDCGSSQDCRNALPHAHHLHWALA
jgi:hypothetical protein